MSISSLTSCVFIGCILASAFATSGAPFSDASFTPVLSAKPQITGSGDGSPLLYPPGHQGAEQNPDLPQTSEAWMEEMGRLLYRLQLLEEELARLSGVIDEQGAELRRAKEEQRRRYLDLDQRLANTAGGQPPATSEPTASFPEDVDEEQVAYMAAFKLVRGRSFNEAVTAFQSLVQAYPEGKFAGGSLFWLGEIYLILPEPEVEKSRQVFTQLVERFPNHKRVPEALYKLGHIHDQLGQREKSVYFLRRVIAEYPSSSAAQLATNYLSESG